MTITPDDVDTLARTIYGEARGETRLGKIAVGWAIRNRVETDIANDGKPDWWGEGYIAVCRKPMQFSCWNVTDPNRKKLEAVDLSDRDFRDCMMAALIVMQSYEPDPTWGSTHYCRVELTPGWSKTMNFVGSIGHHKFYREKH